MGRSAHYVEFFMYEAAKLGAPTERFPNLEAAISYIAGSPTCENEVRPWVMNVETRVFLFIGDRVQRPQGALR
jgi:hypothetical protein